MGREVKLRNLWDLVTDLEYPRTKEAVLEDAGDTTLLLADGRVTVATVLEPAETDGFETPEDLLLELMLLLPRRAVGEPHQSEGEG